MKKLKFSDLKRRKQNEESFNFEQRQLNWRRKLWNCQIDEKRRISIIAMTAMDKPSDVFPKRKTNPGRMHVLFPVYENEDEVEWLVEAMAFGEGTNYECSRGLVLFRVSQKEFNQIILACANEVLQELNERKT